MVGFLPCFHYSLNELPAGIVTVIAKYPEEITLRVFIIRAKGKIMIQLDNKTQHYNQLKIDHFFIKKPNFKLYIYLCITLSDNLFLYAFPNFKNAHEYTAYPKHTLYIAWSALKMSEFKTQAVIHLNSQWDEIRTTF